MASPDLLVLIRDLESIQPEEFDEKVLLSVGAKKLSRVCEALDVRDDFDDWATPLFHTMERLDDSVDLGSPGPIVDVLENRVPQYESYLFESITRKPTALAVWMVDRLLRTGVRDDRSKWLKLLQGVLESEGATVETKECAEQTLEEEG